MGTASHTLPAYPVKMGSFAVFAHIFLKFFRRLRATFWGQAGHFWPAGHRLGTTDIDTVVFKLTKLLNKLNEPLDFSIHKTLLGSTWFMIIISMALTYAPRINLNNTGVTINRSINSMHDGHSFCTMVYVALKHWTIEEEKSHVHFKYAP